MNPAFSHYIEGGPLSLSLSDTTNFFFFVAKFEREKSKFNALRPLDSHVGLVYLSVGLCFFVCALCVSFFFFFFFFVIDFFPPKR